MTAVLVGTLFSYVIVRQQATFTGRQVHRAGHARTGHVLLHRERRPVTKSARSTLPAG